MSPKDFVNFKTEIYQRNSKYKNMIHPNDTQLDVAGVILDEGAGLSQFIKSVVKATNPKHWIDTAVTIGRNVKARKKIEEQDKEIARLASGAYADPVKRKSIGSYQYIPDDSDTDVAVYKRDGRYYVSYRGTSKSGDILPDLSILAGVEDNNNKFDEADAKFKQISTHAREDPAFKNIQVTGHSLGGTKALYVAEQNGVNAKVFNPGYNAVTDDRINVTRPESEIFVVHGDPLSNTILAKTSGSNIKVLPAASFNPVKNHSITNFTQ